MADLFDYFKWRGDLSFGQSPFNEVDGMILARLSYIPFEYAGKGMDDADGRQANAENAAGDERADAENATSGERTDAENTTGGERADTEHTVHGERANAKNAVCSRWMDSEGFTAAETAPSILAVPNIQDKTVLKEDVPFLEEIAKCPRFRNLPIHAYENKIDPEQQSQFSAITVELGKNLHYVAFRGTDSTLVGWKEDFNMGFMTPVPSQKMAVKYLEKVAKQFSGPMIVGGHSKGGNLAVFASAFCAPALQKRIRTVYNFDGPGFEQKILDTKGYQRICGRVKTFVPQSSVVGMILFHEEEYTTIHSNRPTGFLQHDTFSWEVERDHFLHLESVDPGSQILDSALKTWLSNMTYEQREKFIEAIYQILLETNAQTTKDLEGNWFANAKSVLKSIKNLDEDTRKAVGQALGNLMRDTRTEIRQFRRL